MTDDHPLGAIGWSFAAGVMAGLVFVFGCDAAGVTAVTSLVDRAGDGVGLADAAMVGWFVGNVVILVHHVLPAVAWR